MNKQQQQQQRQVSKINRFHLPKQALNFTKEFYAPPVVMVTVNHFYDNRNLHSVKPENNALNTWIEVSSQYPLKK